MHISWLTISQTNNSVILHSCDYISPSCSASRFIVRLVLLAGTLLFSKASRTYDRLFLSNLLKNHSFIENLRCVLVFMLNSESRMESFFNLVLRVETCIARCNKLIDRLIKFVRVNSFVDLFMAKRPFNSNLTFFVTTFVEAGSPSDRC